MQQVSSLPGAQGIKEARLRSRDLFGAYTAHGFWYRGPQQPLVVVKRMGALYEAAQYDDVSGVESTKDLLGW